ncbi:vacuolar-sorting protein BRO1 isoform X3 [Quercus suber]|uniref:vacuolar-sorting protein BRO1 isoform X3 n=1 Tax=Quercus suber TaxID=58331 RepID=UPI0032DFBF75
MMASGFVAIVEIESALPSLARPIMSLDANEDVVVDALKQSLEFGQPKACIEAKKKQPSNSDIQSSLKQEVLTWFGLWTDQTLVFYEKQENLSKLWDILAV